MDRVVITVALAGFLIRMGNLMNSEIYGIQTDLPWGFKFVRDYPVGTPVELIPAMHPTQIYEALAYLAGFIILYQIYKKSDAKPRPGLLFGVFMVITFGARILVEFIKQPQVGFEVDMTLNMGQWLSIPLVITGLVFIYNAYKKKG